MKERRILNTFRALDTSDGAGVRLKRALGHNPAVRLDPFLMLDAFSSDNPDDYVAGFPAHPHRGFETVTYLVEGHMKHRDHLGNEGDLKQGGVQWMTAGRGIIHEEMPQQQDGLLRGFQLWINLPAAEKMKPAGYRDVADTEMPRLDLPGGGREGLQRRRGVGILLVLAHGAVIPREVQRHALLGVFLRGLRHASRGDFVGSAQS